MIDVAIVLVNWNNRSYLEKCLGSIEAAGIASSYEIVVADHGSTDGSREMLAERFPQVKVVVNEGNVGVARGNNQGIQNSTGRYIYILNNDTLVNRPSIQAMVQFLDEHPDAGAVGGNLVNPDGTLQSSFCFFPTLREEFLLVTHIGRLLNPYFPSYKGRWPDVRQVDWISSASIMVRRSAIEQIGLIDEQYFIYSDETDWQYRLRKSGWKVYYLPEVSTVHFGGGSFSPGSRRYTLVYRGRILFARKHYGRRYWVLQRTVFAAAAAGRMVFWSAAALFPRWSALARKQLGSNWETFTLCLALR